MLTHQGRGMVETSGESAIDFGFRFRLGAAGVAEGDGDVAQPAFMTDTADRAALQAFVELGFAPGEERNQARGVETMARIEIGQRSGAGEFVPGADQLTVVAAIDAVTEQGAQFERDRAMMLDREVADAAAGIEPIRGEDGAGRTDLETGLAGAAMAPLRTGGFELQARVDFAHEKERALLAIEQ
jgi:hypothetical protein